MRDKEIVALVHVLLLCGFLVALAGCGSNDSIASATSPTNPTSLTNPTGLRLWGYVSTATGQSLPGATVLATWSSGSATTVSVGNLGSSYELSIPVAGDVTVRVEKDGYDTQERGLTVTAHTRLDIPMPRTLPSDRYRLTFIASPSCSLPAEITQRRYTAGLQVDTSGQAKVYLTGPKMLAFMGEAGFTGTRDGDAFRFQVNDDDMGPWALIEFLPGTGWLTYSGTITGRIDGDRIDGVFNGRVQLVEYPAESVIAECTAADHRMDFVR